ncbi:ABC transporter substrate-binding protein [Natrarchaeobaculum aegyptiacum]|uniref:Solute-binding protein family 5 domain-containing protein n=1 Tax=Natrarchaeobaculum aegyptiacum TaxID=745377 RepID=A0A2Z2HSP2_9EURY|nr:ABC transporter substrate-binding protein [Natrarchaeobaculum aegyptiacum]ARS90200.1 hypothetical protein B1756_11010 [Natrarchaeobaculum aegyptiacum]
MTTAAILAGCADGPGAAAGERVGPLTLEVGQNTNFPDVAQEVARQWGELGVEFEIETDTWGPYVPRIYSDNEFENVAHSPWGSSPDRIDPDFFLSTYRSDSVQNIPGYENEEYDELFREQRAAYDPEERTEIISEMQEILHEDLPEITYLWVQATLPVNSRLWDITPTEFVGARTTGSMTVLTAEPLEDERQLVVGGEQELDAPNPLAPDSNDVQYLFKLAYDTPMRVGLDGEVTEWAVEDVEEVDEETLDLTLREGMTFHDGEPVTAEDLAFTFNFLSEYNFPSFDAYTADIDGAETETDLTVRVELDGPNVAFVNSALTFINLLPEHIWADVPDQADEPVNWNADVDDLVGSGPLEITEWTGTELQYEAFDDHFEPVAYDEFIFVNRASMEAIRSDFEAENIHMTTSSPPISVTEDLAENDYIEMSNAPGVLQQKFSFDLSTPPFDDKAFRQALLLAVDTDRLSDIFWDGYTDIGDGTLLHPRSELTSDHLPQAEQDLEEARTVLEDAGYTLEDGVLYYPE